MDKFIYDLDTFCDVNDFDDMDKQFLSLYLRLPKNERENINEFLISLFEYIEKKPTTNH
ncbi:MAG: hypothetical protein RR585_05415 [Coprobacillus sp.]